MKKDDRNPPHTQPASAGNEAAPDWHANRGIRVMLLDDHPVVRFGLSAQLMQVADVSLMGDFESSRDLLHALSMQEIDVLVMDYSLGAKDMDGIGLLRMLRTRFPLLEILVVSSRDDPATVAMALRAGARGYMSKAQSLTALVEAVRTVASHRRYIAPMLAYELSFVLARPPLNEGDGQARLEPVRLSPKEREVLRCVIDGMTVKDIAAKFSRSINTISTQKQSAYRKLGIRSDIELANIRHGLDDLNL